MKQDYFVRLSEAGEVIACHPGNAWEGVQTGTQQIVVVQATDEAQAIAKAKQAQGTGLPAARKRVR